MTSVIVPAHDEERTIARCLTALQRDAAPGELEIVVACNGCTDATAEVARGFPGVRVVETAVASKSQALNLGDQAVASFPRIYVDADVELTTAVVRRIASLLADDRYLAASPAYRLDLSEVPRRVRWYYDVWTRLRVVQDGLLGSGVYGVSRAGWNRIRPFPDLIADDAYVHHSFAPEERAVVRSESFLIRPPRTLRALTARKVRVFVGNRQLHATIANGPTTDLGGWIRTIVRHPGTIVALPVFLYVSVVAKVVAGMRIRSGSFGRWNQDHTSRSA